MNINLGKAPGNIISNKSKSSSSKSYSKSSSRSSSSSSSSSNSSSSGSIPKLKSAQIGKFPLIDLQNSPGLPSSSFIPMPPLPGPPLNSTQPQKSMPPIPGPPLNLNQPQILMPPLPGPPSNLNQPQIPMPPSPGPPGPPSNLNQPQMPMPPLPGPPSNLNQPQMPMPPLPGPPQIPMPSTTGQSNNPNLPQISIKGPINNSNQSKLPMPPIPRMLSNPNQLPMPLPPNPGSSLNLNQPDLTLSSSQISINKPRIPLKPIHSSSSSIINPQPPLPSIPDTSSIKPNHKSSSVSVLDSNSEFAQPNIEKKFSFPLPPLPEQSSDFNTENGSKIPFSLASDISAGFAQPQISLPPSFSMNSSENISLLPQASDIKINLAQPNIPLPPPPDISSKFGQPNISMQPPPNISSKIGQPIIPMPPPPNIPSKSGQPIISMPPPPDISSKIGQPNIPMPLPPDISSKIGQINMPLPPLPTEIRLNSAYQMPPVPKNIGLLPSIPGLIMPDARKNKDSSDSSSSDLSSSESFDSDADLAPVSTLVNNNPQLPPIPKISNPPQPSGFAINPPAPPFIGSSSNSSQYVPTPRIEPPSLPNSYAQIKFPQAPPPIPNLNAQFKIPTGLPQGLPQGPPIPIVPIVNHNDVHQKKIKPKNSSDSYSDDIINSNSSESLELRIEKSNNVEVNIKSMSCAENNSNLNQDEHTSRFSLENQILNPNHYQFDQTTLTYKYMIDEVYKSHLITIPKPSCIKKYICCCLSKDSSLNENQKNERFIIIALWRVKYTTSNQLHRNIFTSYHENYNGPISEANEEAWLNLGFTNHNIKTNELSQSGILLILLHMVFMYENCRNASDVFITLIRSRNELPYLTVLTKLMAFSINLLNSKNLDRILFTSDDNGSVFKIFFEFQSGFVKYWSDLYEKYGDHNQATNESINQAKDNIELMMSIYKQIKS